MDKAIKELGKPDNLICVYSSDHLNQVSQDFSNYSWIDKVFTVYDKAYSKQNNVEINCGARNCLTCHKCYEHNNIFFVNETLK